MITGETGMAGKRSTPEQIVAKLRQVEVLTVTGPHRVVRSEC